MDLTTKLKWDAINTNIEIFSRILSQIPIDDAPTQRHLLTCLGEKHAERFNILEEPNDIHKMIEYISAVLTLTPEDHPSLRDVFNTLGIAHKLHFEYLSDMVSMEKAIEFKTLAIAVTPDGHPDLPSYFSGLAASLLDRFGRLGEPDDIQDAIEYETRAVKATPAGDSDLSIRLYSLGRLHHRCFERFGDMNDLDEAIMCQSLVVATALPNCAYLSATLASLGSAYGNQLQQRGELDDLEKEIKYKTCALEPTLNGHPSLPNDLASLGTSYENRFQRLGNVEDLEKAIEYQSQAVRLTPDGHQNLPTHLLNLGISHRSRFQRLGELGDLEGAIEYQSRALALTPDGHPNLSAHLSSLGSSHRSRFERLGLLDDLEIAMRYQTRALALTPDNHPGFPKQLTFMACYYGDRYERLGEPGDIEKAIEHESRALALTPNSDPNLPGRLTNLGGHHSNRFKRLGQLDDLEKEIQYKSHAVSLIPDDHPLLPAFISNLGLSYKSRFIGKGDLSDLEKAIEHGNRALTLTPVGHIKLPAFMGNLALSHSLQFLHQGNKKDLEKAIEYEGQALAAIPDNHPDSCSLHFLHAMSYLQYYWRSSDPFHLQTALRFFRIASTSFTGAPREKFLHAHSWASFASRNSTLCPMEAYEATINLLPQFIWLGATTDQRYRDLKTVETLAVEAAHAAILSSNYPLALEWLEHARCIVWNQSLMLRSPLDQLEVSHPSLAHCLKSIAEELHSTSLKSGELQGLSSNLVTLEEAGHRHRQLATEYSQLLDRARTLPGFEDLLRPLKSNRLTLAARKGPIVVINCHENGCDALLVLPQQDNVTHVPLPGFNTEKARAACLALKMSVESLRLRERGAERRPMPLVGQEPEFETVLAVLWSDVVKPVLDYLGYTKNHPAGNMPHVTWCPTGALTFLPLHAAGDYNQPRSRVFDYVISSYTPTLTALLKSTACSLSNDSRVLAVGQAATPGHSSLPGTAMELDYVKVHMQGKVEYTQLMDGQAPVTVVLDEMERHDWVHLACHAHQNVNDAKKSGFFLHGGILDLDAINRRSFKGKGLAFLSACQTAAGDEALPDEAVHLASGMLMAGYSSVIATMWSVGDEDAPFVADKVYAQLMIEGKLGNGEAGRALHDAVAGLRESVGEKEFERWVPFVHIGS